MCQIIYPFLSLLLVDDRHRIIGVCIDMILYYCKNGAIDIQHISMLYFEYDKYIIIQSYISIHSPLPTYFCQGHSMDPSQTIPYKMIVLFGAV